MTNEKYERKLRREARSRSVKRRRPRRVPTRRKRSHIYKRFPRTNLTIDQLWKQDKVRNDQELVAVPLDLPPESSEGLMRRKRKKVFSVKDWFRLPYLLGLLALILVGSILWLGQQVASPSDQTIKTSTDQAETDSDGEEDTSQTEPTVRPVYKSLADRELALQEDLAYMDSLYLYYDYVHLSLEETVQAFLAEQGLDSSQVAFTYKNLQTNEVFSMNDTQPMTAGSTYKLPLNMLVVDAIEKGEVSETEAYDITSTPYEYKPEHDAYVANYNGKMTIADMQYGSIVVSENTPAYALSERIGGMVAAYGMFGRYGQSKNPDIPTFSLEGNKTTSSYYSQVLDYLYNHRNKYADLLLYLDLAFPGEWYEEYVHGVTVYQKPGYVREALNIDAIVMEETPYSIALYTANFGGASEDDLEIDGFGYNQVVALAYVINQWHRINMNPAKKAMVGHYPI